MVIAPATPTPKISAASAAGLKLEVAADPAAEALPEATLVWEVGPLRRVPCPEVEVVELSTVAS